MAAAVENFADLIKVILRDPDLIGMRPVIEKELLHYEIFEALDKAGLLRGLVFQGGTALRLIYKSNRFSEDLDFTCGKDFKPITQDVGAVIQHHIGKKFGLEISTKQNDADYEIEGTQIDKYLISIQTADARLRMPKQRIKIELRNIPAHTSEIHPLQSNYLALAGRNVVAVKTESLDEILADKLIAFPMSVRSTMDEDRGITVPDLSRVRYRDVWDIAYLLQCGAKLNPEHLRLKIGDYALSDRYLKHNELAATMTEFVIASDAFKAQMKRFITPTVARQTLDTEGFEEYLTGVVTGALKTAREATVVKSNAPAFRM